MRYFFLLTFFISYIGYPAFAYATIDIIYVYDGDTVQYRKNGKKYRLRIYGINAPEIGQPYAKESTIYLRSIIENARKNAVGISVRIKGKDSYGRIVGSLYFNTSTESLGAMLIEKGLARVYKKYCKEDVLCAEYLFLESKAKKNALGIWSRFSE